MTESLQHDITNDTFGFYLGQTLDEIYMMLVVNCSKIPYRGLLKPFLHQIF